MQWRPMTTFPESWHDCPEQYFGSFVEWICFPDSPKWGYIQNYNVNKWQMWFWESFLGQILASPGAMVRWHCWQNMPDLSFVASMPRNWYIISQIKPKWTFCGLISKFGCRHLETQYLVPHDSEIVADRDFVCRPGGCRYGILLGLDLIRQCSLGPLRPRLLPLQDHEIYADRADPS